MTANNPTLPEGCICELVYGAHDGGTNLRVNPECLVHQLPQSADNSTYVKLQGLIAKAVYGKDDIGDVEMTDIEVISKTLDAILPEFENLQQWVANAEADRVFAFKEFDRALAKLKEHYTWEELKEMGFIHDD